MDATTRPPAMDALLPITEVMCDGVPFEEVLHVIAEEARKRLPFDALAVVMIDETMDHLLIHFARRISNAFRKRYRRPLNAGITSKLIFGEHAVLVPTVDRASEAYAELRLENDCTSLLCVPLVTSGGGVGYLQFERTVGEPFTSDDQRFAQLLANLAAVAREAGQLREQNEQLTFHDPVTQLLKYNTFLRALRRELERATLHASRTAIGLLDIDNFKPFSEIHGLRAGHELLAAVAGVIKAHLKKIDLAGRLGLDDLIFAVYNVADQVEAERLFESIRQAVEAHGHSCSKPHPVATVGGMILEPGTDIADFTPIILQLRHALYLARNKGGNQVLFVEG